MAVRRLLHGAPHLGAPAAASASRLYAEALGARRASCRRRGRSPKRHRAACLGALRRAVEALLLHDGRHGASRRAADRTAGVRCRGSAGRCSIRAAARRKSSTAWSRWSRQSGAGSTSCASANTASCRTTRRSAPTWCWLRRIPCRCSPRASRRSGRPASSLPTATSRRSATRSSITR